MDLHVSDGIVESVTVDMGEPVLEDESLYNSHIGRSLTTPLAIRRGDGGEAAIFVSMGNPHYVIFIDNVDQVGETGRVYTYEIREDFAEVAKKNIDICKYNIGSVDDTLEKIDMLYFSGEEKISEREIQPKIKKLKKIAE